MFNFPAVMANEKKYIKNLEVNRVEDSNNLKVLFYCVESLG
jgi:hypothetical protein